jgi:hypothetical protein
LKKEIFLWHGAFIDIGREAVSEVLLTRVTDFMSAFLIISLTEDGFLKGQETFYP